MLCLVAAVGLMGAEPSAAGLAGRFSQIQAATPGEQPTVVPYAGWSRSQLDLEHERLSELRPSVALPVTLLASGAAIVIIDLAVTLFAGLIALTGSSGLPVQVTAGIATAGFIGAGLIIVAVIMLVRTLAERREVNAQLERVKSAIERLSGVPDERAPAPEPGPEAPTPGPVVPLQVQWSAPVLTITLARF